MFVLLWIVLPLLQCYRVYAEDLIADFLLKKMFIQCYASNVTRSQKIVTWLLNASEYLCFQYLYRLGAIQCVQSPNAQTEVKTVNVAANTAIEKCTRHCLNKKKGRHCLCRLDPCYDTSVELLKAYMEDWHLLDRKQHQEKYIELLKTLTTGLLSEGAFRQGQLKLNIQQQQYNVCRNCFVFAHDRGHTYHDKMVHQLKGGQHAPMPTIDKETMSHDCVNVVGCMDSNSPTMM